MSLRSDLTSSRLGFEGEESFAESRKYRDRPGANELVRMKRKGGKWRAERKCERIYGEIKYIGVCLPVRRKGGEMRSVVRKPTKGTWSSSSLGRRK